MKTEFLKGLGLTDEQISQIQAESGKDVQKEKDKAAAIQTRLDEANTQIQTLNESIKGSERRTENQRPAGQRGRL